MKKHFLEKIKRNMDLPHLIANRLIDVIWVLDIEKMTYIFLNPFKLEQGKFSEQDLVEYSVKEHLAPESYKKVITHLGENLDRLKHKPDIKITLDVELTRNDGPSVWMEITAVPLEEEGQPFRVVGVSKDITERKVFEIEREDLIKKLEEALAAQEKLLKENKILRGLLPICSGCKKIRDEDGNWWPVEEYIASRTEADFTHTICPDCTKKLYPDFKVKF